MRKKLLAWWGLAMVFILNTLPSRVLAGGEGLDMPEALDHKASLEGLSGISLFFAKAYNENLVLYALYCTVLMAVLGVAIAFVTDIILKAMGMEVTKIEHKE